MKLSNALFCVLTLAASCASATAANAATITAIAEGDRQASYPAACTTAAQVVDGDFTLRANTGNPSLTCLGDGVDETIDWDFDFTSDADLAQFLSNVSSDSSNLISAIATFTVIPANGLITTDSTGIRGVKSIKPTSVPGLPAVGNLGTFSLDLLAREFEPEALINSLTGGDSGKIPWFWGDDVIIHSATLELESRDVPEPMALLGLLGAGLMLPMMKRSKPE